MDVFNKTVKKLSEEDYKTLLENIGGNKLSKPYKVLETARTMDLDDSKMLELLDIPPSTYYTLKSRLKQKISSYLSKEVDNPISVLLNEVARVPANLFGSNREVSIRALKDLEKQLIEYDLSNELIVVYKTLARLYKYSSEHEHYQKQYSKHIAYSLSVVKAEDLFYDFIVKLGLYQLSGKEEDLEGVKNIRRELENIRELYESHRLFVLYNIVKIYDLCTDISKREFLKSQELEIEQILQEMQKIFNKYNLDTFYQNIKFVVNFLYFEYYQKTGNYVRAHHYYKLVIPQVPDLAEKFNLAFFISQFLISKVQMFLMDDNVDTLLDVSEELKQHYEVDEDEVYHYIVYQRFLAICKFYQKKYSESALIINNLRNAISLKQFMKTDVECKLFQALQYCFMGEEGLCLQYLNSVKRQISDDEVQYENVEVFIKLLKTFFRPSDNRKKLKRLMELWAKFTEMNQGENQILTFVKLDERTLKEMLLALKG